MSEQVKDFLKEILSIEEGYDELVKELCNAHDLVYGKHCFLSPIAGIRKLRDTAMEAIELKHKDDV
jgi:hypothetical protein